MEQQLTPHFVETMWCHYSNMLYKLHCYGIFCGTRYEVVKSNLDYYTEMHELLVSFSDITSGLPINIIL